jgi:hypothetical protein
MQNYNLVTEFSKKPWDELQNILWLSQTKPFQGALFAPAIFISKDLFRTGPKFGTSSQRDQIFRLCKKLGDNAIASLTDDKNGLFVYYYDLGRIMSKIPDQIEVNMNVGRLHPSDCYSRQPRICT